MTSLLRRLGHLLSGRGLEMTPLPEKPDELVRAEQALTQKVADHAHASRRIQSAFLDNLDHAEHVRQTVRGVVDMFEKK